MLPRAPVKRGRGPAHAQIEAALDAAIDRGRLAPGDRLPAERLLAERYGVSRMTLRQALGALERRGRLVRNKGRYGGTFVLPIFERVDFLSLELMTIDVRTPEVYTQQGVPIIVDGVAQIKIKSDDVSIATSVEQFLSKDNAAIMNIATPTLEGHLRAILGTMPVEETATPTCTVSRAT